MTLSLPPYGIAWRMPMDFPFPKGQGRNLGPRAGPSTRQEISLRACGARPSEGRLSATPVSNPGEPGNQARSDFLGGAHSVRPRCMTPRMPRVFDTRKRLGKRPVARWGYAWVKRGLSFRACRARPSRGASPRRMALRGKPGHNAGGGFLGGAQSPRPDAEAVIKPRHNMIIGAKRTPGGLEGTRLGQAQAIPAGLQSPPLLVGLRTWPLLGTNKKTFLETFSPNR